MEPQETTARLRWRIDGVLHDFVDLDLPTYNKVLSRFKLLSGMKLNIKNQAQDGRFAIQFKDAEIEIRSSIIPEPTGESVVMRILNPKSIQVPVEALGIEPNLLAILDREMAKPHGMILTTGPTGSGKTTALYAFLQKVYTPEEKIITLEDPVEYHLKGIVQTQINEKGGYTFASGLRAILRQDPDIIMVGEIRDAETAKTAVNAALTGHLVLSTLHTNNAAGVLPRLLDLGVEPTILPPALNIAMAQRLIRKLCEKCKVQYDPTEAEKALIKKHMDAVPPKFPEHPDTSNAKLYKSVGCPVCKNIGYKGRLGIFEAILMDDEMSNLLLKKPSESDVMKVAYNQGMVTMQQDGIFKVLKGITDLEELERVVEL
jgi:type II secretory ATPase GspE/PulE/Tfp pilus assembly ATPase PilB-like protein